MPFIYLGLRKQVASSPSLPVSHVMRHKDGKYRQTHRHYLHALGSLRASSARAALSEVGGRVLWGGRGVAGGEVTLGRACEKSKTDTH